MLWNRFDAERATLNIFDHPQFEPGSGITDRHTLRQELVRLRDSMEGQPHPLIKARAIEYIAHHTAIQVNPKDWFGFNFFGWVTPAANLEYRNRKPLRFLVEDWIDQIPRPEAYIKARANFDAVGAGNVSFDYDHSVPDWDSVLSLGFRGILERAEHFHLLHRQNGTLTAHMDHYYTSVEITYRALLKLLGRFLDCVRTHMDDDEKMPIVAQGLEVVTNGPPRTFYQFLLLIFFYHLLQENLDVVQVRSLGNLDVDGYPFYKADLEKGTLTKENAIELLQFFYESYTNQGHKFSQPLYIGGFGENGESLINELSYTMIQAYDRSCIVNPKLIIKVMPNTPDQFLKTVLAMLRRGNNSVVFVNEELGCQISRKLGRSEEETRRLVATGCNNFASRGNESTPEHVYVNLAKGIELVFSNGVDPLTNIDIGIRTGDISQLETFEDFRTAYIRQTEHLIEKAFTISDFIDANLLYMNPTPIYSGAMLHSVQCGKDGYFDGCKYPNTVMFLSCSATAADCLMMVKKYVYDQKKYTLAQMRDALLADFAGYEEMRQTLLQDPQKYGNDMDSPDNLFTETAEHFARLVNSRKNVRGGRFVVNGESIINAHTWANRCGATPDGRKRGDLLSKNMSACIGQDRRGITAHIKSATKVDATKFPYGCPFDYLLHPSAVSGEDGLNAWLGLLRTFMKRGGYGFQGSVQDAAVLRDAQLHPEKYPNLQVRIAGWSWFFTKMEKKYQDEFIRRAELLEA